MAGRPKSLTLYRKGNAGNWLYFKPGRGVVDTGLLDRFAAEQKLKGDNMPPVAHDADPVKAALNHLTAEREFENRASAFDWSKVEDVGMKTQIPSVAASTPVSKPNGTPVGKASDAAAIMARHLTPEKREKMMAALGIGMARINGLVAEGAFYLFGRKVKDDYILRDKDLELIKVGFECLLEDLFGTLQPKWYHLVLVGNIFMFVAMIPHTEKRVRKLKGAPPVSVENVSLEDLPQQPS